MNRTDAMPAWQRVAIAIANLAAFAALCAVLAYWGWLWLGPQPVRIPPAPIEDVVVALAVSPPFGAPRTDTGTIEQQPLQSAPLGQGMRLLGVLAEGEGRGRALFRMGDGSAQLVAAGAALGEGTLVAVRPDGVTIRDSGGERTIALRPAPPTGAVAAVAPTQTARAAACAIPQDYKGPVIRLNAELVAGLIAQPEGLRAIAEPHDGALVVRDEAGFAAMLGMKKGDRVTQANGIALRAPEDIIVAVLRPLAASQVVRIVGQRGSEPRELIIVNASSCRA